MADVRRWTLDEGVGNTDGRCQTSDDEIKMTFL